MYTSCVKCSCSELFHVLCAYFLCFDIKLKKSCSVFDLVKVLISKQSFFNITFGLFSKVNHIYME